VVGRRRLALGATSPRSVPVGQEFGDSRDDLGERQGQSARGRSSSWVRIGGSFGEVLEGAIPVARPRPGPPPVFGDQVGVGTHPEGPLEQPPQVGDVVGRSDLSPTGLVPSKAAQARPQPWAEHDVGLVESAVHDPEVVEVGDGGGDGAEGTGGVASGEAGEGERLRSGPRQVDPVIAHVDQRDDCEVAGSVEAVGLLLQPFGARRRERSLAQQRPGGPLDDLDAMVEIHVQNIRKHTKIYNDS